MSGLTTITPREASIFACLTDTVVAPQPVLPAVHETDAAFFFDRWLARAPAANRAGLRALLWLAELSPLALGFGARLRRLPERERARLLALAERRGPAPVRQLAKVVKGIAFLAYYGDERLLQSAGYDADAVVARGRELRARDGRP